MSGVSLMFQSDGNGRVMVYADGVDLASPWCSTPEAAVVAWCESARRRRAEHGQTAWDSLVRNGKTDEYALLNRVFGTVTS